MIMFWLNTVLRQQYYASVDCIKVEHGNINSGKHFISYLGRQPVNCVEIKNTLKK